MSKILKLDKGVQSVSGWVGTFTAVAGAFGWLSTKLKVMTIGWAEAVFIGVGAALIFMLVLSASLVAWRYFRPLASSQGGGIQKIGVAADETNAPSWAALAGLQKDEAVIRGAALADMAQKVGSVERTADQTADIVRAFAERDLAEYRKRELDRWAGK